MCPSGVLLEMGAFGLPIVILLKENMVNIITLTSKFNQRFYFHSLRSKRLNVGRGQDGELLNIEVFNYGVC